MKQIELNANLIKKYHQELVFNYSEYPTKDHQSFDFTDEDYKKAILDWIPKNQDKKYFFISISFFVNNCVGFVHVVNSSLRIRKVKDYLKYLNKEIDLLFNYLNANNIKLNVGTVFFGGGS